MIILGVIIWYLIGLFSFTFWWTKDFNFTTSTIPLCLCAGIIGPFAFIVGYSVHGGHNYKSSNILINKKDEK